MILDTIINGELRLDANLRYGAHFQCAVLNTTFSIFKITCSSLMLRLVHHFGLFISKLLFSNRFLHHFYFGYPFQMNI